jgi:hypothetical protein
MPCGITRLAHDSNKPYTLHRNILANFSSAVLHRSK